jgi:hypothetical protein
VLAEQSEANQHRRSRVDPPFPQSISRTFWWANWLRRGTEYRRQGYATAILRQSLLIARPKLGLERVLVTCGDDNVGSIKTIEKNGGVLESIVTGPDGDKPMRRYWIATADYAEDADGPHEVCIRLSVNEVCIRLSVIQGHILSSTGRCPVAAAFI